MEVGGTVPLVVVGGPLRSAGHERQYRSGAVQGLYLGLVIHA